MNKVIIYDRNNFRLHEEYFDEPPTSRELERLAESFPGMNYDICRVADHEQDFDFEVESMELEDLVHVELDALEDDWDEFAQCDIETLVENMQ